MAQSRIDPVMQMIDSKNIAYEQRTIPFHRGELKILYIKQLVDTRALYQSIIEPLVDHCAASGRSVKAQQTREQILYAADCFLEDSAAALPGHILNGMVVVVFSNDAQYLIVDIKKVAHRQVDDPQIHFTIRGPRDTFVENLDTNLSLIKYRIKDPSMRIDMETVGARTQTSVAVIYIADIANDAVVQEIKKKISGIVTDGIWGTGELQGFLEDGTKLFPRMGVIERSDWACEALLEGRVVIMAEGGQLALIAPHTFHESLIACDDRYDNKYFGMFSRLIRYIALFLSLCLSSMYIAIVSFHSYVLPVDYNILLSQLRKDVLFSPLIEVLILEFLVELIRESLMRVPNKIGMAIGIVGAIVIGQAATSAGVFSPLMLIIVATSLMASFAIPDYFSVHPIRLLKFFVILMTGFFGFYGFELAITVIATHVVSIRSFGVPYMAPYAPFNRYDAGKAMLFNRSRSPYRQQYLQTKDDTRTDFYHARKMNK